MNNTISKTNYSKIEKNIETKKSKMNKTTDLVHVLSSSDENDEQLKKIRETFPMYKKDIMRQRLANFWDNKECVNRFIPIILGKTKISLRLIDWFATNYAKKYNIMYKKKNGRYFCVHNDYKAQLDAWHKEKFDPFCRKSKGTIDLSVDFQYCNKSIHTTIGQLNFFKWAIENEIIDYVIVHYKEIENDMNNYNTVRKNSQLTKRNGQCSVKAKKSLTVDKVSICVTFE